MQYHNDRYYGLSTRIAKWKEPSDFEMQLAEAAEVNPKARALYALYYRQLNPAYYEKGKKFAREEFTKYNSVEFANDDFDEIYHDMVYCLHRYGLSFQDYCVFDLRSKSESERESFVADKLRYYYCDILNAPDIEEILTNKIKAYKIYKSFFKREAVGIESDEGKTAFLKFVKRFPRFIYKPLSEHSGHGIEIINLNDENEASEWYDRKLRTGSGIAEELIEQGDKMKCLNQSSINTCRVMTFVLNNEVVIPFATLRIGVGDAITDNAGSGGVYAALDPDTGICISSARNFSGQNYIYHPTSGFQIIGYQLPDWEQAKALVRAMAIHRKGATMISWDIAYSKKGWCMVEGNDNGGWRVFQSNFQKGRKKDLYALMDEYFKQNPNNRNGNNS